MKTTLILLAALLGTAFCSALFQKPNELDAEWSKFKTTYGKKYATKEEEMFRKQIFAKNLIDIMRHNIDNYQTGIVNYTMGLNQFSDMTDDEFQRLYTSNLDASRMSQSYEMLHQSDMIFVDDDKIPDEIDWTLKGIVSPVKNQGICASCWAFGAIATLESAMARKTGKLIQFSEQELIDCSRQYGSHGCDGGWMDEAFNYVQSKQGISTEQSYPYLNRKNKLVHQCHNQTGTKVDIPLFSFRSSLVGDENVLKKAVAEFGPVSVAINTKHDFHKYHSGVYDTHDCPGNIEALNHCVNIVGYGTTKSGQHYWKVKNSWGTGWGDEGYIYMARGKNLCGIANYPIFPIFEH